MCNAIDWSKVPAYEWTVPAGEAEVTLYFAQLSYELRQKLTAEDLTGVESAVEKILKWGGIKKYNRIKARFADRILDLWRNYNPARQKKWTSKTILAYLTNSQGNVEESIASWTKVLAAAFPGKFFIYDSRVAMALCMYYNKYDWYLLPADNGQRNIKARAIINKRENHANGDIVDSYVEYLKFLEDAAEQINLSDDLKQVYMDIGLNEKQAKMAHLEKMLFMAGQ